MAFHIRDAETDATVRKLARKTGLSMTAAIRLAADEKLARIEQAEQQVDKRPLRERIKDIQDRVATRGRTSGLKADKEFYDWLSGDE